MKKRKKKRKNRERKSSLSSFKTTCLRDSSVLRTSFGRASELAASCRSCFIFLWLFIPSAAAICNPYHESRSVSKNHNIKMYIYKKCNKYKAQGEAQEPVGKPVGGCAWHRRGCPRHPRESGTYRDITVFLHQFNTSPQKRDVHV